VKTRIGWSRNELEALVPALLQTQPAVLTIHARTRDEMSLVPARWEHVQRTVAIRDELGCPTLVFGNGDVSSITDAFAKSRQTGCDGVMIGRAIFGNPWLFAGRQEGGEPVEPFRPTPEDKLRVLYEHTMLYGEILQHKPFAIMKKHFKAYVHGWDGAKELRMKLMEANSATEFAEILETAMPNLNLTRGVPC
jgi:tRNA-dihydrouridine synthase